MTVRFLWCAILLALPLTGARVALAVEPDEFEVRVNAKLKSAEAERIKAAEQIRKDTTEQIEKLEGRLAEVRQWTKAQFELGERGVIDKPKVMTPVLRQMQKERERDVYQFLQFADKSGGAIESGRALNTLLAAVGPAAYQHHLTRQVNPGKALPLYEATALAPVNRELLDRLVWKEKTLGSKRVGRFNGGPLDIEWPSILNEDRWKTYRVAIESARNQFLTELDSKSGLSPKTNEQLRTAVAALNEAFDKYRRDRIKALAADAGVPAQELARLHAGQRQIRNLIATVYQAIEATSSLDIASLELFPGGNIEDFLAYMQRNNFQFDQSTKATDRQAYYRIFDLMVRYYLDIKAMTNLEEHLDYEIGKLKQTNQDAINVALGKTMSADTRAALMIEEMKYIRALIK